MSAPPPPSVAFVAWQGLSAALPQLGLPVGGLETSAWTCCRALAETGRWRPVFIARSPKRLAPQIVAGVEIRPHVDRWLTTRREVARFLERDRSAARRRPSPRLIGQMLLLAATWPFRPRDPEPLQPDPRLTRLADPDVWVAMGVSRESAGVVATAKAQSRPSLVMLQSNADLDPRYLDQPQFVSQYGERAEQCLFAIREASLIVCQTEVQQRRLRQVFGRMGWLVRNPCDLERWTPAAQHAAEGRSPQAEAIGPLPTAPTESPPHVLWIGRYETFHKRIDLALEIARRCPQLRFRLIVNPSDADIEQTVRTSRPENVELVGRVPFDEMPQEFAAATAFLCTGAPAWEGFPNVLLQAAASGTPIVSLEDFDDFLARSGSGLVTGVDLDAAAEALEAFVRGQRAVDRGQVRHYLETHHSLQATTAQLEAALRSVLPDRKGASVCEFE